MAKSASANGNGHLLPDWGDMQGLVLSAYPHLDQAAYLLFQIDDPQSARSWIAGLLERVTPALKRESTKEYHWPIAGSAPNLNIAFTHWGLQKLCDGVKHFSDAFEQGMYGYAGTPAQSDDYSETHRSRLLGDRGDSEPGKWWWGGPPRGPKQAQIDVLLMVFVDENQVLEHEVGKAMPRGSAATLVHRIVANRLSKMNGIEHFGFKDGISQPILEGSSDAERFPDSIHVTALGEIVLGYPDASGQALGQSDRYGRTAPLPSVAGNPTFGLNGTYLVVRQLEQHVHEFWDWIVTTSGTQGRDDLGAQHLAAKLVGRWADGTPLVPYANRDDNEFLFDEDPYGYGCPMGSHVRRSNPRTEMNLTRLPLRLANDHRILRRGRTYGSVEDGAQGLLFVGLNADIERQFEFIQHTWLNNSAFRGLENELDPLVGEQGGCPRTAFTIPSLPAPHSLRGLPRFVTVRGGQYFFMPGIRALREVAR
jgi:Dyp-type peroxidase family